MRNLRSQKNKKMQIQENISLLPHNTFGINAHCRYFAEYENIAELREFLKSDIFKNNKFLHIGAGSNLLFLSDFNGIILHSKIKGITKTDETANEVFIKVGAGVVWDDFVQYAVENNFGGAENLSLIPGEVGAAAVQNIGAYGVEAKDIISSVEIVEIDTLQTRILKNEECKFAYRESIFKNEAKGKCIVTNVVFRLSKKPFFHLKYGNLSEYLKNTEKIDLQAIRNAIIKIREEKLPDYKILGNAGSFFKNPYCDKAHFEYLQKKYPNIPFYPVVSTCFDNAQQPSLNNRFVKLSAAWLIEQCGWKGKTLGGAAVYHLQPLVLVNQGNAKPKDVANLAAEIQKSVKEKFCVELETEVNFI